MREWLSGRASASQADGREFESRFPLQSKIRLSNRKRIRNLLFLLLFFSLLSSPFALILECPNFVTLAFLLAIPSLRSFRISFPAPVIISPVESQKDQKPLVSAPFLFSALFSFRSSPRMSEFRDARSLLAIPSLRSLRISFPAPVHVSPVESQKDQKPLVSAPFSFLCSLLLSLLSSNVRIS